MRTQETLMVAAMLAGPMWKAWADRNRPAPGASGADKYRDIASDVVDVAEAIVDEWAKREEARLQSHETTLHGVGQ